MAKRIDIDRAIDAFRRTCPDSTELKHLDGTTEPYECLEVSAKSIRIDAITSVKDCVDLSTY